ncbi:MAG: Gfo/Idh/MocA family oxidoreductase [Oscillospiraceae bacterium]|nr:Gfo/Idh/MocA family oxidoreductase [Oscillospiraceae bacterium]
MNISIVGCGSWAHYTHLPCIMKCEGVTVISCADINVENAKSLHEKFNIPLYFTDYHEMLEKTNPDAIVCLVSENAMAETASGILSLNYPVMLEKPPGKTVKETNMIFNAAKKSGKPHMVAFNRRFVPVYTKLKEMISDYAKNNGDGIKYINYRMHRIKRFDSNFEDTAIHAVDAVKFLADDDFKRVEIKYQEMPGFGKNIANYFIFFEFINGIYATAEILVSTGELYEGCEIHAGESIYRASIPMENSRINDGGIEYRNAEGIYYTVGRNEICPYSEHYMTQGFYNEHKHFYECLKNGTNPKNGADTAVQSVAVCNAIKNREHLVSF